MNIESIEKKNKLSEQGSQIRIAMAKFSEKLPQKLKTEFISDVDILPVGNFPMTTYNISNSNKKSLIVLGQLNDLNDNAVIGLIAHLYGLISIGYDKKNVSEGEIWLQTDLYADDLARSWGFEEEVDELRKIRPQNIPIKLEYDLPVMKYSAREITFARDMKTILDSFSNGSNKTTFLCKNRILYTGKFSLVCSIELLRNELIDNLIVITQSYKYSDLIMYFSKLINGN